ncbi:MAG: aspartate kinase [Crocinitomicaceae bacterium]|nr:aspartate kinase [Crocinitomicaceae bacterium]
MRVFKFGGASVKDASAVKNVARIIDLFKNEKLVVVISAMGKTTNALEAIMKSYWNGDGKTNQLIDDLNKYHQQIIGELFSENKSATEAEVNRIFEDLKSRCAQTHSDNYNFEYDQIISLGEVISTKIVAAYLASQNFKTIWMDARKMIRTTDRWREANIDWEKTEELVNKQVKGALDSGTQSVITQGFIGHTPEGFTTTLGREGSDFTAAILAYCLNAEDVTIWKDVPGMLNADPKYFDNTVLLEKISFREAIELAYFGASVIHPKTIQPLKKKNIPLHVKSFIDPHAKGSVIQASIDFDANIPSFIFKMNQVLISLTPKDFSFVVEENLEEIFSYLSKESIRIHLMQNSAVSFSFCVDGDKVDLNKIFDHFTEQYFVKYNEGLELVTIRHYDQPTIERVTVDKKIYLEQKSRHTARIVMKDISDANNVT